MGAFEILLLAHLLGDFPCQPYVLLRWKLASVRGVLVHVAIQAALALPVLVWLVPAWGWWLLFLGVSHFLIDWAKIRLTRGGWVELVAFFLDQALHIAVLGVIVRVSGAQAALSPLGAQVLRLGIVLVAAVYAGTVVVFLVGAALRGPDAGFRPIPLREWVRGVVERAAAVAAVLLLPAAGWTVPAAVYIGLLALRRRGEWVKPVVSVIWALVVTLVVWPGWRAAR